MTGRERLRWAAPTLLAAAMPLVAHGVVQVVGPASDPAGAGVLVGKMAWAAMPFVALAALALFTRRPWSSVRLAMGIGWVLTAAVWAVAAWNGVRAAAGQSTVYEDIAVGVIVGGSPVALLSVMVTAAAVRAAFVPRPTLRGGGDGA